MYSFRLRHTKKCKWNATIELLELLPFSSSHAVGNHGNEQVCRNECLGLKIDYFAQSWWYASIRGAPWPKIAPTISMWKDTNLRSAKCSPRQPFMPTPAASQPPKSSGLDLAPLPAPKASPKPGDWPVLLRQSVSQACTPCGEPFQGAGAKLNFIQTLHAHWQQKSRNLFKCCSHSSQFWAASSQWTNPW